MDRDDENAQVHDYMIIREFGLLSQVFPRDPLPYHYSSVILWKVRSKGGVVLTVDTWFKKDNQTAKVQVVF